MASPGDKPVVGSYDEVERPAHYNFGRIEVLDFALQVCRHYPGDQAAVVKDIIKYVSRAPHKGSKKKDLLKAQTYLKKLIELVEESDDDA